MTTPARVSVSISAGPIEATPNATPLAGQQVRMGDNLLLYIKPEIARQWIDALTPIAAKEQ